MKTNFIEPERVKQVLDYNPKTGQFYRKIKTGPSAKIGLLNIKPDTKGRMQIRIDGVKYMAHRLAWAHFHNEYPNSEIDHIDGNVLNNAISNLRLCNRYENCANTKKRKNNTSGFKGVSLHKSTGKWRATIMHKGKKIALGLYDLPDQAAIAYQDAAIKLNGQFARPLGD